jgi:hypothetical protein
MLSEVNKVLDYYNVINTYLSDNIAFIMGIITFQVTIKVSSLTWCMYFYFLILYIFTAVIQSIICDTVGHLFSVQTIHLLN